ncbi:MAG: Rieske 2Fe-2S domain-containing protein [Myxococcota bacterium]
MRGARITSVAVYEREIRASLERIWENVLDWEHLPGLHRDSFASVRRIDSGDWGWSAYLRGRGAPDAREMTLQVLLDRENLRYVTATIDGPGKGTEIWTSLTPLGEGATQIRVEFRVPGVSPERVATLGAAYRTLYARLWDEDEAMMMRREKWLAPARGAKPERGARAELGSFDDVRAKLPLVVELGGRPWRVVALDDELVAHAALCPHFLGPLEDAPLEGATVECPWHRYRFDVRTGRSCDGRGLRLAPAPRVSISPDRRVALIID